MYFWVLLWALGPLGIAKSDDVALEIQGVQVFMNPTMIVEGLKNVRLWKRREH